MRGLIVPTKPAPSSSRPPASARAPRLVDVVRREARDPEPPPRASEGDTPICFALVGRDEKIRADHEPVRQLVTVSELLATQPKVFAQKVGEYEAAYRQGLHVRRVLVLHSERGNVIWDGHHRAMGALRAGIERVPALVFYSFSGLEVGPE